MFQSAIFFSSLNELPRLVAEKNKKENHNTVSPEQSTRILR